MARKRKGSPTSDDDDDFVLEDDAIVVVDDLDDGEFQKGDDAVMDDLDDDAEALNGLEEEEEEEEEYQPKKKKTRKSSEPTAEEKKKKKASTGKKTTATTASKKKKESSAGGKKRKTKETAEKKKGGTTIGVKRTVTKPETIKNEAEAREVILQYMQRQNRPYNVQNVMDNLQGRVKKAMTTRVLDKLVEEGSLSCKENGKAKVFMLNQGEQEVLDANQLKALDNSIAQLNQERTTLKEQVKMLQAEKDRYTRALTHEQILQQITELREVIEAKKSKLSKLNENKESLATPEEKAKAIASMEKFRKTWRARRRIANNIIDSLSEGMEKKPSVLKEELDIEDDPVDIKTMGTL